MDGPNNDTSNPLWTLPRDDPRCSNSSCQAFITGYQADQSRYSDSRYPAYAEWTTYFYCATIALFAILYLQRRLCNRVRNGSRLKERGLAYWRMATYRRIEGWLGRHVQESWGQLALLAAASVFAATLPFAQGYFLRRLFRYGSPPLSVRCAMLISALLPIMVALAGKVNVVSLLTGISYARLNVWHRYVAFVVYALVIVHLVGLVPGI
jgi:hypothetical protein